MRIFIGGQFKKCRLNKLRVSMGYEFPETHNNPKKGGK